MCIRDSYWRKHFLENGQSEISIANKIFWLSAFRFYLTYAFCFLFYHRFHFSSRKRTLYVSLCMYSCLRLYFSSRMRSVCVSLPFCVPYLPFHFRSRTRSLWVWVTLYRLSAFPYTLHLHSVSVFPFCVPFSRSFFYLLHSVHYQSVQIRVIAVCVLFNVCFLFFYHLMVPFKAHLIFFFLRNSMQFLSRWSCISKKKPTFEDILKCYQSHSNQGLK